MITNALKGPWVFVQKAGKERHATTAKRAISPLRMALAKNAKKLTCYQQSPSLF